MVYSGCPMGYGGYGGFGAGLSTGNGYLDMLLGIIIWGGIIFLIVWLVMKFVNKTQGNKAPLDILKERYAQGEITKKEFEEKKKELRK